MKAFLSSGSWKEGLARNRDDAIVLLAAVPTNVHLFAS